MALRFTKSYIEDSTAVFRQYKRLCEEAMDQLSDQELLTALDNEMNSIAIIVKHLSGNMRSRWTDFLTSDGEKPDRNRDSEFEEPPQTREEIISLWEEGWQRLLAAITPLSDEDLSRTVFIRGEPHSVMQAINRQIAHCAYHAGQIVFLAKHFKQQEWRSLSVPRGRSQEFNREMSQKKPQ